MKKTKKPHFVVNQNTVEEVSTLIEYWARTLLSLFTQVVTTYAMWKALQDLIKRWTDLGRLWMQFIFSPARASKA